MRGKPYMGTGGVAQYRLIPAYAGKTFLSRQGALESRAHPRVCGENHLQPVWHPNNRGSSPRMRGKRRPHSGSGTCTGLIPAYAGKTPTGAGAGASQSAHPRVCGENIFSFIEFQGNLGSSPRMRGKRKYPCIPRTSSRLIPAYAGKTRVNNASTNRVRAHPRVCGENTASS